MVHIVLSFVVVLSPVWFTSTVAGQEPPVKARTEAPANAARDGARAREAAPDFAAIARGLALEDVAWLLGDKESYRPAIAAFTDAVNQPGAPAKSLVDRGRCRYKSGVSQNNEEDLKEAINDLTKALAQKLSDELKVEACYWLGLTYAKEEPPDYEQAKKYLLQASDVAAKEGTFRGGFAYGLEALAAWGETALKRSEEAGDDKDKVALLGSATDTFDKLGRSARKCGNEKHVFWAANRMRTIGEIYEVRNQPVDALAVYRKGLPADFRDAGPAHVRLLNVRNALFTKDKFKEALKDQPARNLIQDAQYAIELAGKKHQWLFPRDKAEAHFSAALCYQSAGDTERALAELDKAEKASTDPVLTPSIQKARENLRR
jgi:tetratricopeptide (TPR) repeat protein